MTANQAQAGPAAGDPAGAGLPLSSTERTSGLQPAERGGAQAASAPAISPARLMNLWRGGPYLDSPRSKEGTCVEHSHFSVGGSAQAIATPDAELPVERMTAISQKQRAVAAGPLLGLYGLGSAIAGVWYGSRRWKSSHASRLTAALAVTVLGTAPLAFIPGIWPMAAAITAAGLGISATLASSYRVAQMAVPPGQRTEAMSWLTTAAATGTAVGAPLAGRLIDFRGAPAGYLFAFAAGLAAVAITLLRRSRLTASPDPPPGRLHMTAPVPVTHEPEGSPPRGKSPVPDHHAGRLHRRQRAGTP
jgi:hypothetical protein